MSGNINSTDEIAEIIKTFPDPVYITAVISRLGYENTVELCQKTPGVDMFLVGGTEKHTEKPTANWPFS